MFASPNRYFTENSRWVPLELGGAISCFIMTCDIFGTGQTNILALCYLFGKTYQPAHSGATQVTEINTIDQINTEEVIDVSTHIPPKALMISLTYESCSVSEPKFKHNFCASAFTTKIWSWVFNINTMQVKKTCQ